MNDANWAKKTRSNACREAAYIASAHADVVDAYDDVVRVFDFGNRPVFILGLSWTIEKAG